MPRDKAIGAAIETCIHEGKLKEFLVENCEEVAAMLNFEYSYETHLNVMRQEGIQLGRQEGRQEERHDIIAKMVKNGISVKQICEITGLGEEEINSIAAKKE